MSEPIIDALATHRLARLVASDTITQPVRDRLIMYWYARRGDRQARQGLPIDWTGRALRDGPDAPKLATLITCRWCSSIWCAFAVVIARRLSPRAWAPVARLLAFSSVAGLLGVWEHFTEPQEVIEVDE